MQPIVHLAIAYVSFAVYERWNGNDVPRDGPTLIAIIGAALPDLIDKPIAFVGLVPVGRTVGHSLLFALPLIGIVWVLSAKRNRRILGIAFAIGYLSHLATDVPWHVLSGDYEELGYLLWPVTDMPPYTGVKPLTTVGGFEITTLWLEAVIFVGGVALWWYDGRPGLVPIRVRFRR